MISANELVESVHSCRVKRDDEKCTYRKRRQTIHDKRRRERGGSFDSDSIACHEWQLQSVLEVKIDSDDRYFKIEVSSQPSRNRIRTRWKRYSENA